MLDPVLRAKPMKTVSKCTNILKDHVGPVFVVRFDKHGQYCLSGGQDKKLRLWNPFLKASESSLIQTYSGHSWEIYDISISHDNTSFVSCGGDRQAFCWDTASGRIIRQLQGHHLKINAVQYNEDSSVIATGSEDKTVRLWDCRSFSRFPLQIIEDAKDSITSISIQDTMIATASIDGHVRLYDLRIGCMNADNLNDPVTSVRLGKNNQCYLASVMNSKAQLIDGPSGSVLNTFTGHIHSKYRLESCFSSDESAVYSCSEDSKIYCWDFVSGKTISVLEGHSLPTTSIAHHPKNSTLLTSSTDGTIRVWE